MPTHNGSQGYQGDIRPDRYLASQRALSQIINDVVIALFNPQNSFARHTDYLACVSHFEGRLIDWKSGVAPDLGFEDLPRVAPHFITEFGVCIHQDYLTGMAVANIPL